MARRVRPERVKELVRLVSGWARGVVMWAMRMMRGTRLMRRVWRCMGGEWVAEVLCRLMALLRSADTSFVVSSEDFGIENVTESRRVSRKGQFFADT